MGALFEFLMVLVGAYLILIGGIFLLAFIFFQAIATFSRPAAPTKVENPRRWLPSEEAIARNKTAKANNSAVKESEEVVDAPVPKRTSKQEPPKNASTKSSTSKKPSQKKPATSKTNTSPKKEKPEQSAPKPTPVQKKQKEKIVPEILDEDDDDMFSEAYASFF